LLGVCDGGKHQSTLAMLHLSNNLLSELGGLVKCSGLKYLDLESNNIRIVDGSAFMQMSGLEELKLGKNKIAEVKTKYQTIHF
jgi:Leucine-rich repeat (LRR) protein